MNLASVYTTYNAKSVLELVDIYQVRNLLQIWVCEGEISTICVLGYH